MMLKRTALRRYIAARAGSVSVPQELASPHDSILVFNEIQMTGFRKDFIGTVLGCRRHYRLEQCSVKGFIIGTRQQEKAG